MITKEQFLKLKKGAEENDSEDLLLLGQYYHLVQTGWQTSFEFEEERCFLGDEQWYKEPNEIRMLMCYKKAEQLGNPGGSYELGDCYFYGYFFSETDKNKAVYYWLKAARGKNIDALYRLQDYFKGLVFSKRFELMANFYNAKEDKESGLFTKEEVCEECPFGRNKEKNCSSCADDSFDEMWNLMLDTIIEELKRFRVPHFRLLSRIEVEGSI